MSRCPTNRLIMMRTRGLAGPMFQGVGGGMCAHAARGWRASTGTPYQPILDLGPSFLVPSINDAVNEGRVYQDTAGTVPVANVGDPVGYIEDVSGADRHLVAPSDDRRPTVGIDTDGHMYLLFPPTGAVLQHATGPVPCGTAMVAANLYDDFPSGIFGLMSNVVDGPVDVDVLLISACAPPTNCVFYAVNGDPGGALSDASHFWRDDIQTNVMEYYVNHVYSCDGTGYTFNMQLPDGLQIGQDRNYSDRVFSGRVYAAALFPQILTDQERQTVIDYFSNHSYFV